MVRVLVTGSRTWLDEDLIATELGRIMLNAPLYAENILVSGACSKGADAIAEELWEFFGGKIERHPADWKTHGNKAGFIRNAEMVNLGADICLAFIKDESKGATMTADLAENKGIPTLRFVS